MSLKESNRRSKLDLRAKLLIVLLATAALSTFTSNAFAAAGDLFVSDLATNSIVVYHPDGTKFTFATGLNSPQGLAFDQFGNLYEADLGTGRLFQFTADGTRSIFASGLLSPVGVASPEDGAELFVAENGGNKIDNFELVGTKTLFASITAPLGIAFDNPSLYIANGTSESKVSEAGDTPTVISSLDSSRSVIVDSKDNIYASSNFGTIFKITPDGMTKAIFAKGLVGPSGMAFDNLQQLKIADHGNLFVAERFGVGGGRISKITPNGTTTTFASGGSPNFLAFEPALAGKLANISTRAQVLTGDNVLIGGFIIPGTVAKQVIIRAIGPSLANANPPVPGPLADPVLELHKPDGTVVVNDNWKTTPGAAQIQAKGLAPKNDLESAIFAMLPPGKYTAIVRGKNGGIGVALVEAFDVDAITATSELANISSRGFVGTGDNVMIGGFIIGSTKNDGARVVVRAIGPSLSHANPPVPGALADPTLELHESNGMTISNDNWMDAHPAAIQATGLAPTDPRESAILMNLKPGPYTAIVRGKNNSTGVALVEVFHVP